MLGVTKSRCRRLRHQGFSIGAIATRLALSESTVHWHVKDIVLTEVQRNRLREQWRLRMVEVNGRRRGIALKPIKFEKPSWSAELVHLIAHLEFDGRVDRYGCFYYNRSHEQVLHVQQLFKDLLGPELRLRLRPNEVWVASYYNVEVADWLSNCANELLAVLKKQKEWQRIWLRALFDDEGHIHFAGSKRRVRASQDKFEVLKTARRFLKDFGIQAHIDLAAKAVEIRGRAHLQKFQQEINFSSDIRINGNRKNGVWHEHAEKRDLLERALSSYRAVTAHAVL